MPRPNGLRPAAALLALVLLPTACGGGLLYIGVGEADGDDGFDAASVSLAALQERVAAGGRVDLAADAADPNGIDKVVFYRLDGRARAIDGIGRQASSAVLDVQVIR